MAMITSGPQNPRPGTLKRAGEVASAVGIGVQTLHYYERIGLLPKPRRSAANYRLYAPEVVRRVQFIRKAQLLGFKLAEIKQILEMKSHGHPPCHQVVELGEKHLREVDKRLAGLKDYRSAVAKSLSTWREQDSPKRRCAGEFCDLIEQFPDPAIYFTKPFDPLPD